MSDQDAKLATGHLEEAPGARGFIDSRIYTPGSDEEKVSVHNPLYAV